MKIFSSIPLLFVATHAMAIPITVELNGDLGPFYANNSRFFSDQHDAGGTFSLLLKFNADINTQTETDWRGPDLGYITRTNYRANGVAKVASMKLNGVAMDLTEDTAGLAVGFWLQDDTCLVWPDCSLTYDYLTLSFGASDYHNNDTPFQLVDGMVDGLFRFTLPTDTFDGLKSTSGIGEMHADGSSHLRQRFNYQFGANQITESLMGSSFLGSQSVQVSVPEPGSVTLFSLGLLGLGALRRKRR